MRASLTRPCQLGDIIIVSKISTHNFLPGSQIIDRAAIVRLRYFIIVLIDSGNAVRLHLRTV